MAKVSFRVREIAEEKGLNIERLAILAGITYNTAKTIWHSSNRRIDTVTLAKLCRALEVLPGDLFTYEDTDTEGSEE